MKQLQQKQQKLQHKENMKKPNNWRKNHHTLHFGFINNLTPAPIQWHTSTREATGRLRAKETSLMSLTSFSFVFTGIYIFSKNIFKLHELIILHYYMLFYILYNNYNIIVLTV